MSTIESGSDSSWHHDPECLEILRNYHDRYARQPDMKEPRLVHNQLMNRIETSLKEENLCKKLIFAGSAYDGLKTGRNSEPDGIDDLEFDVTLVIGDNMVKEVKCDSDSSLMVKLMPREDCKNVTVLKDTIDGDFICPNKLTSMFTSKLQKIVNKFEDMNFESGSKVNCKLKKHGPAVQLDVHKGDARVPYFSVDLVPTFHNGEEDYFVAKPGTSDDEKYNFRRSFSVQEKQLLSKIDSGNGCRKKLTRTLKVMFDSETTLRAFPSYTIKSTMLHLMKRKDDPADWSEDKMADRFFDFNELFCEFLTNNEIPHYFLSKEKTPIKPEAISCAALENARCRIAHISTKQDVFKKVFRA